MRFEPEGITRNPEIPFAKSLPDYIMRWLASRFVDDVDYLESLGIMTDEVRARKDAQLALPTEDTAGPPATEGNGNGNGNGHADPKTSEVQSKESAVAEAKDNAKAEATPTGRGHRGREGPARHRGPDRHPAGPPGQDARPGARPGVRPVRRNDAAHGLVLHVLELRQQHRLRLSRPAALAAKRFTTGPPPAGPFHSGAVPHSCIAVSRRSERSRLSSAARDPWVSPDVRPIRFSVSRGSFSRS